MSYRVVILPSAEAQASAIATWWSEHREEAPGLFTLELSVAGVRLATAPHVGTVWRKGVRRLLLPRTRYHVYYAVDDGRAVVEVRAVWHASRGRGPRLG